MIRLVAIDVDGTLIDARGRIPEDNLRALGDAVDLGVHVVVVTGRSYPFALQAVAPLPAPLTVVAYNGALARVRDGATLAARPLAVPTARRVLAATRRWRASTLVQFDRDGVGQTMVDRMSWEAPNRRGYYEKIRHLVATVEDLEHVFDDAPPLQVAFSGPVAAMAEVADELLRLDLTGAATVAMTSYPARDFALVDVNADGATKGRALAHVAAHFGVARDEVLAIGDNLNDIDMLQWAGTGVVMGNAEPDLLALGLEVTATHDEAGLALALRRHVLGAGG